MLCSLIGSYTGTIKYLVVDCITNYKEQTYFDHGALSLELLCPRSFGKYDNTYLVVYGD
jgi:hypothetical protein